MLPLWEGPLTYWIMQLSRPSRKMWLQTICWFLKKNKYFQKSWGIFFHVMREVCSVNRAEDLWAKAGLVVSPHGLMEEWMLRLKWRGCQGGLFLSLKKYKKGNKKKWCYPPWQEKKKHTDNYSELCHNLPKLLVAICPHRRIILFQYHRIESEQSSKVL